MNTGGDFDLSDVLARIDAAMPAALQAAGEHIGEVSAQQVPIEEGTLLRSQKITVHEGEDTVGISYGTPYARYQHEKLELRHEHGNAKYLEIPLHSEADAAVAIAAKVLGDAL